MLIDVTANEKTDAIIVAYLVMSFFSILINKASIILMANKNIANHTIAGG